MTYPTNPPPIPVTCETFDTWFDNQCRGEMERAMAFGDFLDSLWIPRPLEQDNEGATR